MNIYSYLSWVFKYCGGIVRNQIMNPGRGGLTKSKRCDQTSSPGKRGVWYIDEKRIFKCFVFKIFLF